MNTQVETLELNMDELGIVSGGGRMIQKEAREDRKIARVLALAGT